MNVQQLITNFKDTFTKNALRLLLIVLFIDVIFMIIHVLMRTPILPLDRNFGLNVERSYPEMFQYLKEFSIALFCIYLAWRYRAGLFLAWSALFIYILLDDSMEIHENVGKSLEGLFGFATDFSLRPQDVGEIVAFGGFGLLFFILIGITYWFSTNIIAKQASLHLALLVLLLAFFGVAIDMVGVIIHADAESHALNLTFALLEDGGEHVAMSLILAYTFALVQRSQEALAPGPAVPAT